MEKLDTPASDAINGQLLHKTGCPVDALSGTSQGGGTWEGGPGVYKN